MDDNDGRRSSDVLDAIFDKVADKPARNAAATSIFRAKALEQLDVPTDIDSQLPLVSRRNWLILLGVAVLVLAFATWASLTPSVTSVRVQGRIVSAPGAIPLSATDSGVITYMADSGAQIAQGDRVAQVQTSTGSSAVTSAVAGSVWQQLVVPGQSVTAGQTVATMLPPDSGNQALLVATEQQAAGIVPGMTVTVSAQSFATGSVSALTAPMSAQEAGLRTGLALPATTNYVLVTADLTTQLQPGAGASGSIVLSDGTVLTRLLGRT